MNKSLEHHPCMLQGKNQFHKTSEKKEILQRELHNYLVLVHQLDRK